jgi:outer membrane protein TolC
MNPPRSRFRGWQPLAAAVATLAAQATALAADAPVASEPAGPALSLTAALDIAVHRNTDLGVAKARLAESRATRGRADTAFLPNIQAVGQYTHNSAEGKFDSGLLIKGVASALGLPPPPPSALPEPSVIQKQDTFGAVLTVDQTVFALSPVLLMRAADRNVEAQLASLEATRREIAYQVTQIYYSEAGVERLVQAAERAIALADQRTAIAQQRQAHGAEGEVTVLRAQSERDKAEQDLIRAQAARTQLLVALGTLLGQEPPASLGPPPPLEVPVGNEADLVDRAEHDRPDLNARRLAVQAAQSSLDEARFRWAPMVTLNGTGRYTDTPGFVGKNWLWSVSANLIVPIFDRGLRYAEAVERRETKTRLQLELTKAEVDARGNIRQANADIQTARRILEVAASQAKRAGRTAQIVANAQQAGAATSLEVAEADTNLRLSEVAVERERLNLDLTILKLRHLTGAVRAP